LLVLGALHHAPAHIPFLAR